MGDAGRAEAAEGVPASTSAAVASIIANLRAGGRGERGEAVDGGGGGGSGGARQSPSRRRNAHVWQGGAHAKDERADESGGRAAQLHTEHERARQRAARRRVAPVARVAVRLEAAGGDGVQRRAASRQRLQVRGGGGQAGRRGEALALSAQRERACAQQAAAARRRRTITSRQSARKRRAGLRLGSALGRLNTSIAQAPARPAAAPTICAVKGQGARRKSA